MRTHPLKNSPAWHEDPSFKALQKKWYQKLKASGFEDIEDTRSPRELLKAWHSSYFHCRYTPEAFQFKQEYYRLAAQFLHHHTFETKLEYRIWELHSEGISFRKISEVLQKEKVRLNKDGVNKIVSKLVELMKVFDWGSDLEQSDRDRSDFET